MLQTRWIWVLYRILATNWIFIFISLFDSFSYEIILDLLDILLDFIL